MIVKNSNSDIGLLDYLLILSRARNLSEAAKQCGISQSALSNALKHLEAQLGVRLYDRKACAMTPAGNIYIRNAEQILVLCRECREKLETMKRGSFTLGVDRYLGNGITNALTEYIYRNFPELGFSVVLDSLENLRRLLSEGTLDMYCAFERASALPGCIQRGTQPLQLYLTGSEESGDGLSVKAPGLTFLKPEGDTALWEAADQWMKKQALHPAHISETNSFDLAKLLISQTDTATVIPASVLPEFTAFRLVPMKGASVLPVFVYRADAAENQIREEILAAFPEILEGLCKKEGADR